MRSLQARLIASYVVLALLVLAGMGLVFSTAFVNYAESMREQRISELMDRAAAVVKNSRGGPDALVAELNRQFPDLEFTFVPGLVVVAKQGSQVRLPSKFFDLLMPAREPFSGYTIVYTPFGLPVGTFFAEPRPGSLLFKTFYREIFLLLAMGAGLATLLGWWFSRWLARPISRLTQATAAVAEGDFLQTVSPTGTTELDSLVQQFNRMVQRLSESFRTLSAERDVARRFASDAAHELKTPLTALKAYHETATDRPERLQQVLPGMGRSIDRIEGIITGLLQLARLSEGTGLELSECDAAEALRELLPGYRMLARDAGHTLETAGLDQPLPVRLDRRLLEIALTNLVSNACKFTAPGGVIRIEAGRSGPEAVIAVSDTGPGIAPDEVERIFERFHRGSDTQTIPGSGLGLSIVKEAAGRMGGRVTLHSEVGKGSRFAVHLPLVQ
ncbi:MAG TPA: HAMP domain-containing sensor histidine kinase [Symbiobacteriaceae bacterium]|nr:HAMP domain-containing sensor histidine kinase [Symbiobacteriaceae bacterium]